jgi:hypothetical protein
METPSQLDNKESRPHNSGLASARVSCVGEGAGFADGGSVLFFGPRLPFGWETFVILVPGRTPSRHRYV